MIVIGSILSVALGVLCWPPIPPAGSVLASQAAIPTTRACGLIFVAFDLCCSTQLAAIAEFDTPLAVIVVAPGHSRRDGVRQVDSWEFAVVAQYLILGP